jgi:hypothetical protein
MHRPYPKQPSVGINVYKVDKVPFQRIHHMHKHRRFRHGRRHFRGPFPGLFWLFIFVMMFSNGHWWPGILVLIGLSIIFGSFFHEETRPPEPKSPSAPIFIPITPPAAPKPEPAPVEQIHRADLLPVTCSQCSGPIRASEVKWTGTQSAACPYCGSNLPMKKQ